MENYVRYLAASWFQKQASRLGKQLQGIQRVEDIECVHRARVACRRLRAGLGVFADWPSANCRRRWETEIRRLGRKLGQARDKDVQITFLADVWPQAPSLPVRVGLAGLILYRQTEREAAYRKASKAAARFQKSKILQQIGSQCQRTIPQVQTPEEELLTYPLWQEAGEQIQMHIEELLAYAPSLGQPQEQNSHHAMRIAGKKLRYTLEIVTPILGPEVQPILQTLETFQTLMGQLHDCHVWLWELAEFQKKGFLRSVRTQWEKAGLGSAWTFQAFRTAIQWLQEDRQKALQNFLQEAAGFWQHRLQEKISDRLPSLVQRALLRPAKPRAVRVRQAAMG